MLKMSEANLDTITDPVTVGQDNLSAILYKAKDLRLQQRPVPSPGENEVLIKVDSVGICGSDVHYLEKGAIGHFIVTSPMVLGHETSGIVAEVGSKVLNLKPGDRVAIEPGFGCRKCFYCKTGRYNLCPDMRFCATPPVHGTLCRYYVHAADFCYKLPDNVSFEEGALVEPLSVAVHACRRAKVQPGDSILICGAGPIGLVNLLVAKAMGAGKVIMTDLDKKRLKFAESLGADYTVLVETSKDETLMVNKIKEILEPDITIECSGAESSLRLAVLTTRSGGTVVLVGLGPPEIKVPIVNAAIREVDIRGVFRYANCYPIALSLLASGKVDVKPLVSHRFKLEEALDAFAAAKDVQNSIKVVIKCSKEE